MRSDYLRKKYPKFIYEKYSYRLSGNNLEILFNFVLLRSDKSELRRISTDIKFQPKIIIENINQKRISEIGERVLNNLIFHLGLMEIPSYWKAACSPLIEIRAGYLNQEQIKWWKDLIIKGLGQFFYENKINWKKPNFLKITCFELSGKIPTIVGFLPKEKNEGRVLVPMGGGKDSIVTLEILKKAKKELRSFLLNPTEIIKKITKIAGLGKPIIARRKIDRKLLELNRRGFLNGHTPFSAYLAFLTVLIGVLFDYKYIAFSNEKSADEGNVRYLGKIINHQWSKSSEFEKKFRNYSQKYLVKDIEYFSFLRPLYEIQIAGIFAQFPQYFPLFISCNNAFKTYSGTKKPLAKWCCQCPKCLFVFVSLYPFIKEKEILKIFGKNLFEQKNLRPIMEQLIGERGFKPFECVGTKKESLIAFYLSWEKRGGRTSPSLILLEYFGNRIAPKYRNLKKEAGQIMNFWNNQHNLPKEFEKTLKSELLTKK